MLTVTAAVIAIPRLTQRSLRSQVAEFLQAREEAIRVNLPPAAGRYPGCTVAIGKDTLRLVEPGSPRDTDLVKGEETDFVWQGGDITSASGSAAFGRVGQLVTNSAVSRVTLTIKKARVYEMPESKLSERALRNVSNRVDGEELYVVVRAVEGIPVLKLTRGNQAKADAWATLQKSVRENPDVQISGDTKSDDELSVELTVPVVIAYEVARARFFSNSLGPKPDSVKIERLAGADLQEFEAAEKKALAQ